MKKSKLFIIIFLLILSIPIFGNNSLEIKKQRNTIEEQPVKESLKNEIANLKDKVRVLEDSRTNFGDKFTNKSKELDLKVEGINQKLTNDYSYLRIIGWFFGSITVFGLIISYIGFARYFRKQVIKKVAESIGMEEEKIQNIIIKNDRINKLKKDVKVVVLGNDEQEDLSIFNHLKKFGIKNIERKSLSIFENINCDVIVFNNKENDLSNELINEFLSNLNPKTCFLYYGGGYNSNIKSDNLNFANSKFTLYHRLIETMDVQNILK